VAEKLYHPVATAPGFAKAAATRGLIFHQTSAAEIENGRRFAGIIVIGLCAS
jgi:hypothetical protein